MGGVTLNDLRSFLARASFQPGKNCPRLIRTEIQGTGVHRKWHVGVRASADVAQSAIPTCESISMRVERFYDVMSQLNGEIQPADEEVLGANDTDVFLEPRIGALPDQRRVVGGSVLFSQLWNPLFVRQERNPDFQESGEMFKQGRGNRSVPRQGVDFFLCQRPHRLR